MSNKYFGQVNICLDILAPKTTVFVQLKRKQQQICLHIVKMGQITILQTLNMLSGPKHISFCLRSIATLLQLPITPAKMAIAFSLQL